MPALLDAHGLSNEHTGRMLDALAASTRSRGRPWSLSLRRRLVIVCTSLRTGLTVRELAAVFGISATQVHRILTNLIPRLAALRLAASDDRGTWILDGTLIPTRDHSAAARSKNYRWSCNAQVLVRHHDLRVIAIDGGGPGNRNDPVHYRGSCIETLCRHHRAVLADGGYRGITELTTPVFRNNRIVRDRAWRRHRKRRARVEHALARLKDWRVLRDYRRRGRTLVSTLRTIAFLHNLKIELRNKS